MATINQQTAALVKQKFGPAQRQLTAQGRRIPDWYGQYQHIIANAGQQAAANTTAAVQGVQGVQQGLDTSARQQWAGQQQAMAQDAGVRGAQTDPGLADVAHNAANVRGNNLGSFAGYLQATGLNQQNYLGDRGTIAGQQGLEARQRNAGAKTELATQRGEFAATTKQQLVSEAQAAAAKAAQDAFNRYIQNSQLAISEQNAGTSAANAQASRDLGYARLGIEQQNADTSRYRSRHPGAGKEPQPTSGPGSLTRSTEQNYVSQIHTIAGYFQNPPIVNGKPLSPQQIVEMLQSGKNPLKKAIDPRVVNVARSLSSNGGQAIGPWGVQNAHSLGIHAGGHFKITRTPIRPKPSLLKRAAG